MPKRGRKRKLKAMRLKTFVVDYETDKKLNELSKFFNKSESEIIRKLINSAYDNYKKLQKQT